MRKSQLNKDTNETSKKQPGVTSTVAAQPQIKNERYVIRDIPRERFWNKR